MKYTLLIAILIVSFLNINHTYSKKTENDIKLVGTWSGAQKDAQLKGQQVNWVQKRYPDGKLITTFRSNYYGSESVHTETGKWWTKDGKFFEKSKKAKSPDIYTYEVVDTDHIIFRSVKLSSNFESENYQFVDTRVENDSIQKK